MRTAVERLGSFVNARLATLETALETLREMRQTEAGRSGWPAKTSNGCVESGPASNASWLRVAREISRNELESAHSKARLEALTETVRRELDCEPEALAGARVPRAAPGDQRPGRARELEREFRLMGPVNPLALEEHAALEERHQFLEGQLHDVSAARRELSKVIRAIDAEIITVFKAAYDDVFENFAKLVSTLFPNGQGMLHLPSPPTSWNRGSTSRCVRPARTSAAFHCFQAASGAWWRWPSCSPCSEAGHRRFT